MSWRCVASTMGAPCVMCAAAGDTDRGAEQHTKTTGHPTVSGPNAAPDKETE